MMRRLIATGALAVVAGCSLVGCSSDETDPPPTGQSAKPAIVYGTGPEYTWATKMCSAVTSGGLKLVMPQLDADAKKSKQSIIDFLGDLSKQLKLLSTNLTELGAPPVTGTTSTYTKAISHLDRSRNSIDDASASLTKLKVTDSASLQASLVKVGKALSSFNSYQGPAGDLVANPALKAVFAKSQGCETVVSG